MSTVSSISQSSVPQGLVNQTETDLALFGRPETLTEIIALLSYIRNIINSGNSGEIVVEIGKNIGNDFFTFMANEQEIPDYRAKEKISIN